MAKATPKDSGETASSWSYRVTKDRGGWKLVWINDHKAGDDPVVIMLQYGHGTGTGGYVEGRDFINPAMKPVFDQIANTVWKEVQKS